ncbi:MAG: penicillin-binding transpeptidase domain-containing protein [Myxococcota bacterium]
MMAPRRRAARRVVAIGGLVACAIGLVTVAGSANSVRQAGAESPAVGPNPRPVARPQPPAPVPEAAQGPAARTQAAALEGFDPLDHHPVDGKLVSDLPGGRRAELTLDPDLQAHLESELARYEVPFGAVVAMEPDTGRIRAYVSHSSAKSDVGDLCRDATPPAASVFKVVTGSALVDRGVRADTRVCYGGGFRELTEADLVDDAQRDRHCETLATAMGHSINAIFAKLATRHLDAAALRRYASAFGFGHALPFDAPTEASPMEVPAERLERARTAAGFWHMHMSPLHGALVAATLANGGQMPRAAIVERVEDGEGEVLHQHEPSVFRRVIPRATARAVGEMMKRTVDRGTAKKWFYDTKGRAFLPGIQAAGKTGTLTGEDPYRAYNWWVGFAPADGPELAVAALVVNSPQWRIKAGYLAREALRHQLVSR